MRKDIDSARERQIAREVRVELRTEVGDWAWAAIRARAGRTRNLERAAARERRARREVLRPGTSEGGF